MATHDMLCDHKVHRKGYSVENSKMKLVAVAEKWQQKMRGHEDIAEMIMTEYFISGLGEYDEENYYDGY